MKDGSTAIMKSNAQQTIFWKFVFAWYIVRKTPRTYMYICINGVGMYFQLVNPSRSYLVHLAKCSIGNYLATSYLRLLNESEYRHIGSLTRRYSSLNKHIETNEQTVGMYLVSWISFHLKFKINWNTLKYIEIYSYNPYCNAALPWCLWCEHDKAFEQTFECPLKWGVLMLKSGKCNGLS